MGAFLSKLLGAPAAACPSGSPAAAGRPSGSPAAAGPSGSPPESSRVQAFHSTPEWELHFNNVKETSQLMVIDFAASWCGPCRMMEPALHAMSSKYTDVEFAKIDVDELSDVAQEFGVQAMPTFVLVKKGKEVLRIVGAKKDELERNIQKHRALVASG